MSPRRGWGPGCAGCLPVALLLCVSAPVLSLPADSMTTSTQRPTPSTPTSPAASQDVATFFPSIKGDLTKVTWAHAVNSEKLLEAALNDSSILMLEADVVLGKTPDSEKEIPIMGHPPANKSDLSLQEFLRNITKYNMDNNATRRGVKLDFKSIEVFVEAIDVLKETFSNVPDYPVWLNADILPGPVNSTTKPVDANQFLVKAKQEFPDLTLSLGWTTAWGKGVQNQSLVPDDQAKYSNKTVNDMLNTLNQVGVTQPITYAVRAAFVANSLNELKHLLNSTPQLAGNATLTVWNSDDTDHVNVKKLRSNILAIGKQRVFLDVGEKLEKELDLKSSAVSVYASVATVVMALVAVLLRGLL